MRKSVLIVTGTVMLLFLLFTGCNRRDQQQTPTGGNIFIQRLSNPDEALNALLKDTDSATWRKYLDASTEIKTTDRKKICYHIGVKSANALLSVFLDDYDTAEKISASIKDAANKLNIKSDAIETIAKQLVQDLAEKDEKVKQTKVKQTLNTLKDEVIKALNDIGNKSEAVMIEFGAWIEAIRQTSSIILENYSPQTASALLRKGEAEYFKANFGSFNLHNPSPENKQLLDVSSRMLQLMIPATGKTISREAVTDINELATRVNADIMS
jgi:phosphoglycolate phosphatase-like HAD superfamily hydrolase